MACHNTIKTLPEEKACVSQNKKIWNEVESLLFERMATEPIKGKGSY